VPLILVRAIAERHQQRAASGFPGRKKLSHKSVMEHGSTERARGRVFGRAAVVI
jgi:hypothetical protein